MKLRSLLFVPADSDRKFAKADACGADALILDLEDSVAPGRKALARDAVKNLLGATTRNWQFFVRINPLGTGLTLDDLAAIVRPGLDGILIPKVNGIQDVELISHYVDVLEVAAGIPAGHVKLLVVATETPAAMLGFASYVTPNSRASSRLVAMTWGAEDLSAALGALTNKEPNGDWTFPYQVARAQCLFAANAAGVLALDTLYGDYQGSGRPRRKLPDCAPRRLCRAHRDTSGSGCHHQHLLHAIGDRPRACAPRRCGLRSPA